MDTANALLRWSSLLNGNVASLLPSFSAMEKQSAVILSRQKRHDQSIKRRSYLIRVPKDFNGKQDTVVFEFQDILSTCASLLRDPRVVSKPEDFHISANTLDSDGNREYTTELNSGDWWLRTMEKERLIGMEDTMSILAILLFIDKTIVTRRGRHSYPIILTIGNFTYEARKAKAAHRIIGYLPVLANLAESNTNDFETADFKLRNTCFDLLFASVCKAYADGGVFMDVCGKMLCMIPLIPFIIQDSQEGNKLCFVLSSNKTAYPCRICWTPRTELADENGTNSKRLRTQAEVKNYILGIVDRLEERVHGTVVELRDQARKISVHPVSNSLWNLPWGANV